MYKVFNFHKEAAEDKQFTLEMYYQVFVSQFL